MATVNNDFLDALANILPKNQNMSVNPAPISPPPVVPQQQVPALQDANTWVRQSPFMRVIPDKTARGGINVTPTVPGGSVPTQQKQNDWVSPPLVGERRPRTPLVQFPTTATESTPSAQLAAALKNNTDGASMLKAAYSRAKGLEGTASKFKTPKQLGFGEQEQMIKELPKRAQETDKIFNEDMDRVNKELADSTLKQEQEYNDLKNKYDLEYNAQKKELDDLINNPDSKIDTGRFWKNASTPSKIMMGLGLIFASMTPQSAKAANDTISRAIENDIEAQKADLNRRLDTTKSALGLLSNKFGNMLAAQNALAAIQKGKVATQLENLIQKNKSKQNVNGALELQAKLLSEIQVHKQNAENSIAEQYNKNLGADAATRAKAIELQIEAAKGLMSKEKDKEGTGLNPFMDSTGNLLLNAVPKEQRADAFKERGIVEQQVATVNRLYDTKKRIVDILKNERASLANPFSDNYKYFKVTLDLFPSIKEIMSEKVSNSDFDAMVSPYLPKKTDTPSQAAINFDKIVDLIKNNMKETPLLNSMPGIKENLIISSPGGRKYLYGDVELGETTIRELPPGTVKER